LTQTEPQKILYHSDKFIFRNEYEISTDVKSSSKSKNPALIAWRATSYSLRKMNLSSGRGFLRSVWVKVIFAANGD